MHNRYLLSLFLLLIPLCMSAQDDYDFRSRTSVGFDWKIQKGLHLEADYELRTADKFSRIERHQLSAGLQWSPLKYLDVTGGYSFIGRYNSDKEFKPRHRVYAGLGLEHKFGNWKLSLKEILELTHNSYEFNEFQNTPNLLELKSRFKVSYKGFSHIEPYGFAELRNCFNGPSFDGGVGTAFTGYNDAYVNRVRAALGFQWNIDKKNCIDFRLMNDWCTNKDIDSNAKGTKLKSLELEKSIVTSLCVGYVFSF